MLLINDVNQDAEKGSELFLTVLSYTLSSADLCFTSNVDGKKQTTQ